MGANKVRRGHRCTFDLGDGATTDFRIAGLSADGTVFAVAGRVKGELFEAAEGDDEYVRGL